MSQDNPDQTFRVRYVALRFILLIAFTGIPFTGLVWWKTGSLLIASPCFIVPLVAGIIFSIRDYRVLGRMMRDIEAAKNAAPTGGADSSASPESR